jgi:hypothetical protein
LTSLQAYSAAAPLLLVTAFAPGNQGGGAVILRSLLCGHEANVVWASLVTSGTGYDGAAGLIKGGGRPWLAPPGLLARRIESFADACNAGAIWAVAHGPIVPALPALARISSRRVHLTVHDDPAWTAAYRGRRERPLVPWLHVQFGRAISSAASLDVIGGGMRAAIARRAGRDSVIVHRVLDAPVAVNKVPRTQERLTIGLLGNVYAARQLEQLTAMLARTAELIGIPTRLTVVGGLTDRQRRGARATGVDVEFLGHMEEDDGIELLRAAFALYIGYPFGARDRTIRRTSFPAKLATYVQAARPLLVHAPYDSTLTPLFKRQPFAIPWVDGDPTHGARLLAAAWRSASLHTSQHESAEALRLEYFGTDNRTRLFASLNALAAGDRPT